MVKRLAGCLLLAGALLATPAAAAERSCTVRYLSAEHVYLDAGTAAGMAVGLRIRVVRDGAAVAELEVVYTAEHSASCRVIGETSGIEVGDRVVYEAVAEPESPDVIAPGPARTRLPQTRDGRAGAGNPPRLRGRLGLQWDHTRETADRDLGADVLRLPFRLRGTGLGRGFEFRARGSLRRTSRTGYSTPVPGGAWRNRILELSLVREDHDLAWHLAAGRIGGPGGASTGPFDGLAVSRRLGGGVRLGVFGGFAPTWGELGFSADDHLVGLVARWRRQTGDRGRLDLSLTGAGRYRDGEISREWLSLVTTWHDGGRLSLLQAAEVDVNRGWRKDAGGDGARLSSGALSARYRFTERLSMNLSYDDREPIRTWETRALPDSLFIDAGRQGWRGGLSWRSDAGVHADFSASLRREDGTGEETKSWALQVRLSERLLRHVRLSARLRGFDGPWLSGLSPSLRLDRRTRSGLLLHLEGGHFAYEGQATGDTRDNSWAELGAGMDLAAGWDAHATMRRDWGDDIAGQRGLLDLTHRF
ncbi:MAG: hypothetical protein GY838_15895 [bacterium]|nr:hypothetical protein [bacterium]